MKHEKLQKMVLAAMFAALTYVATNIIHIPMPATGGYINLGDCMVLLGAFLLGPVYGAAAGGIGSMLADLLLGYLSYAPGTMLIKGLMAFCAALIFRGLKGKAGMLTATVAAGIAAECIMVLGYFAYEAVLLGFGMAAAASIPGNAIQGMFGLVISAVLYQGLVRIPAIKRTVQIG